MKNFEVTKRLPSYALDGVNSRGYDVGDIITVQDDHIEGLGAAGYFDPEKPIEDKDLKTAPEIQVLGDNRGLKPPYFDEQDRLVDGGLRPGAADLVGHEARGVNDPENQPRKVLTADGGELVVDGAVKHPDRDDGPTGTKGAVDDADSSAADAVAIPEDWEELSAAEKRELADSLEPESDATANKAEAESRIRKHLDQRAK